MSDRVIWQKEYGGFEDAVDLGRDISECLDEDFNERARGIPGDFQGTLKVTVEYFPDEEE